MAQLLVRQHDSDLIPTLRAAAAVFTRSGAAVLAVPASSQQEVQNACDNSTTGQSACLAFRVCVWLCLLPCLTYIAASDISTTADMLAVRRSQSAYASVEPQGPAPPREYGAAASQLPPLLAAEVALATLALECLAVCWFFYVTIGTTTNGMDLVDELLLKLQDNCFLMPHALV